MIWIQLTKMSNRNDEIIVKLNNQLQKIKSGYEDVENSWTRDKLRADKLNKRKTVTDNPNVKKEIEMRLAEIKIHMQVLKARKEMLMMREKWIQARIATQNFLKTKK